LIASGAKNWKESMNVSERVIDDLTAVKGIGEKRQQWLQEALGVKTYQDLARLSVDEIESQLKADGHVASRSVIEDWIQQAHDFAGMADRPLQKEVSETAVMPKQPSEWQPAASFVVEFQTRTVEGLKELRTSVHYMEEDSNASWPGIEQEQLGRWMKSQVSKKIRPSDPTAVISIAEDEPDELEPGEATPVKVEIKQLHVFQPPGLKTPTGVAKPGRPFMGLIKGNEPCEFEVACELIGSPKTTEAAKQANNYRIQLQARNLSSGITTQVEMGEKEVLMTGNDSFTMPLAKTSLQPGMYRFGVVVRENRPLSSINYLELPVLHVV
jgi:hypothetical protein